MGGACPLDETRMRQMNIVIADCKKKLIIIIIKLAFFNYCIVTTMQLYNYYVVVTMHVDLFTKFNSFNVCVTVLSNSC